MAQNMHATTLERFLRSSPAQAACPASTRKQPARVPRADSRAVWPRLCVLHQAGTCPSPVPCRCRRARVEPRAARQWRRSAISWLSRWSGWQTCRRSWLQARITLCKARAHKPPLCEILSVWGQGRATVAPWDALGCHRSGEGVLLQPAVLCSPQRHAASAGGKCGVALTDGTLTAALLCRSAAACRAAAAPGGTCQSACQQCMTCPLLIWGWPIIVTVTLCLPCTPCPVLLQQFGGCGHISRVTVPSHYLTAAQCCCAMHMYIVPHVHCSLH